MIADADLGQLVAVYYASEAPARAPDWVLATVLSTIDLIPQRHALGRLPARIPTINIDATVAVVALAAAAGAIGALVLALLGRRIAALSSLRTRVRDVLRSVRSRLA